MNALIASLGPHGGYIAAAFAATGLILGFLVAMSLLAHRDAARRLAALEARRKP